MRDLTIDICVLRAASGKLSHYGEQKSNVLQLLQKMLCEDGWAFALDAKNRIKAQYFEDLRTGDVGHHWVISMTLKGKVRVVPSPARHISVRIQSRVHRAGLTKEDAKYVETAAGTESTVLVSHNSHCYTLAVRDILEEIPVKAMGPVGACCLPH